MYVIASYSDNYQIIFFIKKCFEGSGHLVSILNYVLTIQRNVHEVREMVAFRMAIEHAHGGFTPQGGPWIHAALFTDGMRALANDQEDSVRCLVYFPQRTRVTTLP